MILLDAIAMGVDEAWLATDSAFAGADTWATSLTLAECIKIIGDVDLIICGLKTTDGDTGQTGPEIAEHLGMPHVCYVNEIIEIKDNNINLRRILDDGVETLAVDLPLLITVSKDINQPRLATLRGRLNAKKAEIRQITNNDLQFEVNNIGLEGSYTRVIKIFEPEEHEVGEVVSGDPEKLAEAIFRKLQECKVI